MLCVWEADTALWEWNPSVATWDCCRNCLPHLAPLPLPSTLPAPLALDCPINVAIMKRIGPSLMSFLLTTWVFLYVVPFSKVFFLFSLFFFFLFFWLLHQPTGCFSLCPEESGGCPEWKRDIFCSSALLPICLWVLLDWTSMLLEAECCSSIMIIATKKSIKVCSVAGCSHRAAPRTDKTSVPRVIRFIYCSVLPNEGGVKYWAWCYSLWLSLYFTNYISPA